jgi:hypothetical protein
VTEASGGRVVIACYRPKPGKGKALKTLMDDHVPTLRRLGLATKREAVLMEAKDGTLVEVFEWASAEAIQAAHTNPAVLRMWEEFGKVCDFVPMAQVPEAAQMFSEFAPVAAPPARGRARGAAKAPPR